MRYGPSGRSSGGHLYNLVTSRVKGGQLGRRLYDETREEPEEEEMVQETEMDKVCWRRKKLEGDEEEKEHKRGRYLETNRSITRVSAGLRVVGQDRTEQGRRRW